MRGRESKMSKRERERQNRVIVVSLLSFCYGLAFNNYKSCKYSEHTAKRARRPLRIILKDYFLFAGICCFGTYDPFGALCASAFSRERSLNLDADI